MRLPCLPPAILTEQGSLNPAMSGQTPGAKRLSAHGLVGVAIREIYFPSDAARVIKRGELDSVRIAGAKPRTITVNAIIEIGIGIEVPYFFDFG